MNNQTLNYATLGAPSDENSIVYPVAATGTSLELVVPALPKSDSLRPSSRSPSRSASTSIAGASNESNVVMRVPQVTNVENPRTHKPGGA